MKIKHIIGISIFLGFLVYDLVNAQNFNDALRLSIPGLGSSARALSLGNSYSALSNDYSGAFFNPAGLGLVSKQQVYGGLNYTSLNNNTSFFNNNSEVTNSSTDFSQFGMVFPVATFKGSLVFSIGYGRMKDFSKSLKFEAVNPNNSSMIQDLTSTNDDIAYLLGTSYPVNDANGDYLYDDTIIRGGLNQSGNILQSGNINAFAFSGAIEIAKDVYLGASLDILNGNYKNNREYTEEDVNNLYTGLTDPGDSSTTDFQSFYLNDILSWDISGWDFKTGVLYKLNPLINIGATIKFPSHYTIKESYFVSGESTFGSGQVFTLDPPIDNKTEYDISTPYEFTTGAALNLPFAVLTGQVQLIDYKSMEFTDGLDQGTREQNNRDINNLFRGVVNYNLGFEYRFPFMDLALRGGFIYQKSPFKDDPQEFDKKYFTAGLGIAPNSNFAVNLAYAHGWWKNFGDNYGVNESRTFQDIKRNNFILNFVYQY